MVKYVDIVKSVTDVLKLNFKGIPVYGDEVTEGYKKPSFFINLYPIESETSTQHTMSTTMLIVISYYSDTRNSIVTYDTMNQIRSAFGLILKVNDRSFLIDNRETEKIERDGICFQYSFSITFFESLSDKSINDGYDKMQEINTRLKIEN